MGAGFFVNLVTKNSRGDGTASTDSGLKEKKALIYNPFFQFRGSLGALDVVSYDFIFILKRLSFRLISRLENTTCFCERSVISP